jgi:energy-coupling factor transporter transmembrane protein EcfT
MSKTDTIDIILSFITSFIIIPFYLITLALIVLAIMGKVKKDFSKFKKLLKIWGWFWLALLILFAIYAVNSYFNEKNINSSNTGYDATLEKICTNSETKDIAINNCDNAEYFTTYPNGLIMDAGVNIYDKNGDYIITCGGYKTYISEEARNKESETCQKYPGNNCDIAKKTCIN